MKVVVVGERMAERVIERVIEWVVKKVTMVMRVTR